MQGEKLETKHNHRKSHIEHGVIRSWALFLLQEESFKGCSCQAAVKQ